MPTSVFRGYASRQRLFSFLTLILCACALSSPASANSIFLSGGGGDYQIPAVKTFAERRFVGVIRQKFDFSCGSAALATLLTYHYGRPIDEIEVLETMYSTGDQEKIHREGFSLLDMKQYLQNHGYKAEGFRESLDKLNRVGIPAIVLINKRGYLHFVVVKGVTEDKVSVGDPTRGVVIYDRDEFTEMWNGILFVIVSEMDRARPTFNTVAAWKPYGVPNFRNMLGAGLGSATLNIAYSPGYY